jgi:D-alanyl-D-alanine dipeptidase
VISTTTPAAVTSASFHTTTTLATTTIRAATTTLRASTTTRGATPPLPAGADTLVEVILLDRAIHLDIRYATESNFTGRVLYTQTRAFLQRPAAEALVRVHRALAGSGFGLTVFDGYRPTSVNQIMWDATPPDLRAFVANPSRGSRHNRGCSVDVTLYSLATGAEVTMPSGFDEFSSRASVYYDGGTAESRRLRDLLRSAMQAGGFTIYEAEWWHYDWPDSDQYPLLDVAFERL